MTWLRTFVDLPRHIQGFYGLAALFVVAGVLFAGFGYPIPGLITVLAGLAVFVIAKIREPARYEKVAPLASVAEGTGVTGVLSHLTPLERVCFLHLYHREDKFTFGLRGQFQAEYFLNLMEAALVPDRLATLVEELATYAKTQNLQSTAEFAAGPKRGNALLIVGAAEILGLPVLLTKERPLFGQMIEGPGVVPGVRALLLDDISSDGEMLEKSVTHLRESGVVVEDACVLIDRGEGDAAERLGKMGVRLHAFLTMSDRDLARLAQKAHLGQAKSSS